jgi:nucleotide-binding universal stress UspA family protein
MDGGGPLCVFLALERASEGGVARVQRRVGDMASDSVVALWRRGFRRNPDLLVLAATRETRGNGRLLPSSIARL